jgi:uridine kinase
MNFEPFIVGIIGASGSGKTTLLKQLCDAFAPDEICLISQDNYYYPIEQQQVDENGIINFDLPFAINLDKYYQDILQVKSGNIIQKQEYTFNNLDKKPETITLTPAPIIIVEGLFIFHHEQLRNLFDLKIFVDVEDHIGLKRRILRDNEERGYDLHDVLYRYEFHVFPAYQKYIAPHKYEADIIIPNNHNFEKGLAVLLAYLKTKV